MKLITDELATQISIDAFGEDQINRVMKFDPMIAFYIGKVQKITIQAQLAADQKYHTKRLKEIADRLHRWLASSSLGKHEPDYSAMMKIIASLVKEAEGKFHE